ncbi:MAG: EamA family transporter, partial [Hyphomicrobiales bacterium]
MRIFREHMGALLVWSAILVFAASNSIVRLLYDLGASHPVDGRNAISFCNVLFVGNLCAMMSLLAIYRKEWAPVRLRKLARRDWGWLVVLSTLSAALAPALGFLALERADVTSVVLIGRIEPLLFLVLTMIFLGESAGRWSVAAAAIAVAGA